MSSDFWNTKNPIWGVITAIFVITTIIGQITPDNELDMNHNDIPETFIVRKGFKKVQYRIDGNEDGEIDIDEYLDKENEKYLVRKDIDLNFDSSIDLIVHYNKSGTPYNVESPNNYYDLYASSSGVILKDYIFEPKYVADDIKSGGELSQWDSIEEYRYVGGVLVSSESYDIQTGELYSKMTYGEEIGEILRLEVLLGDKWEVIIPK